MVFKLLTAIGLILVLSAFFVNADLRLVFGCVGAALTITGGGIWYFGSKDPPTNS